MITLVATTNPLTNLFIGANVCKAFWVIATRMIQTQDHSSSRVLKFSLTAILVYETLLSEFTY